jgi:hypothetical protein
VQYFGIEYQTVDQHLALGQFERLDAKFEAGIEFVDGAIGAPPQRPAHARHQDAVDHRQTRQHGNDDDNPQRHGNLRPHSVPLSRRVRGRPPLDQDTIEAAVGPQEALWARTPLN